MISWRKSFKKVLRKTVSALTVLAVIFSSLGSVFSVPIAQAAATVVISTNGLPNQMPGAPVPASSFSIPISKISITPSASATLTSIALNFDGMGFGTGDLLALAANETSGVALYKDEGSGTFGLGDTPVVLTLPVWSSTNVSLAPAGAENLTASVENIYFLVIKTSASISNNDQIRANFAVNGIVTSAGSGPASPFSANDLRADTAAFGIISATKSGAATFNVKFNRPTKKAGAGFNPLTAAEFTFIDHGTTATHTISSVTHVAGQDFAIITVTGLDSGDFVDGGNGISTIAASGVDKIADMGGNLMGVTPVNLSNPPLITTNMIPNTYVGANHTVTPLVALAASGGSGGYVFTPNTTGAAPSDEALLTELGLTLNADGTLTGTIASKTGSFNINIKVTDGAAANSTKFFNINVAATSGGGVPGITFVSPGGGAKGASNFTITLTGANTSFSSSGTISSVQFLLNGAPDSNITVGTRSSTGPTNLSFPIIIDTLAAEGSRDIKVTTGTQIVTMPNGFGVFAGGASGLNLMFPGINATNVQIPPNFTFNPSSNSAINSYRVTVNTLSTFTGTTVWDYVFPKIGGHCSDSNCNVSYGAGQYLILTQPTPLNSNTTYYWQVKTYAENPSSSIGSATAVESTSIQGFTTVGSMTDTMPPNIMYRPLFQAKAGTELNIFARVMDNFSNANSNPPLTAKIYYCTYTPPGEADCAGVPAYANDAAHNGVHIGNGYFKFTIPFDTIGAAGKKFKYYLEASDGANTMQFKDMSNNPFQLTSTTLTGATSSITGVVKDGSAVNIDGATIFADGTGFNTTTSGGGATNYTLGNLPAGTYDLIAVKDGYGDRRIDGVPAGSPTAGINFTLSLGGGGGFGGDLTNPRIKFTGPMDGMNGIPGGDTNFKIFAAFNKLMSQTSITASGNMTVNEVNMSDGSLTNITSTKGSWAYYTAPQPNLPSESNLAVWSFSGVNTFGDNKTIAVKITPSVTDTAGNSIQGNQSDGSYAFMFTTGSSANFSGFNSTTGTFSGGGTFGQGQFMPPHVIGTNPAPGNFNVPPNAKLIINFSDPMADDVVSVYSLASNVKLFTVAEVSPFTETDVTASAINTVALDTAKMNATVNLKSGYNSGKFAIGAKYRLKVLGGAKAANGMTIAPPNQVANFMFVSDFKTGSTEDTGAPTVVGSYPNTNDTNVPTALGAVNVAFSKDMNAATISSSTFYLSVGSTAVNGTVEYHSMERQAFFMPKSALSPNTTYTINITTDVAALNGTAFASAVARAFTTGAADTSSPSVNFINADDYYLAITFSKPMNSASATDTMNFAASVLKPGNLVLGYGVAGFSAPGTAITIPTTASFSYDPATNTLSVQGYHDGSVTAVQLAGKEILATVSGVKDIGGVAIGGAVGRAPIKDSTTTKGALGPMAMSGSAFEMGGGFVPMNFSSATFGFAPPVEVMPFNKMAGQTTIYGVRIPISQRILAGGMIVLTFPTGFDVSGAKQDVNSPMRTDLNGPGTGTITFRCQTAAGGTSCGGGLGAPLTGDASGDATTKGGLADDGVIINSTARTVTIYLSENTRSDSGDTHDFLTIDIAGIKNSTVPKDFNTSGYTIDIKTKNTDTVLESLTSMPFFIQGTTGTTYTLSGTITAAGVTGGTMKVYLMSPMTGPMEQELTFTGGTKTYSFAGLPAGGYGLFTDQFISLTGGNFAGKAFPENFFITADKTYDFTLASATVGTTVTVNITGGPANEPMDVFANSPTGFRVAQITLNGSGAGSATLKLPDGQWYIGAGPQMPKGPMSGPPPASNYLPPKPLEIKVANPTVTETSGTANDGIIVFALTTSTKQIKGLVQDAAGKTMANAEVFAYSPQGGFGTNAKTDSNGSFTLRVSDGIYVVGAFIPGMPPSKEVSVTVINDATTYLLIGGDTTARTPAYTATNFILKVAKPDYTISGKVTDGTNVVQGASVYAYRTNGPGNANAITDSSGNYTIYVSAGTWKVGTFLPQYGNLTELNVSVTTANVANQNFSPSQTGTFRKVSGTVTSGGTPVQGAFVSIRNNTTSNEAITAPDGTYSFNVPVGTGYITKAIIPGAGETAPLSAFDVSGADITGKDISPAAARIITVTFNTAPSKASIELSSASGVKNRVEITNALTGTLSVPDGDYTVRVDVPGAAINLATAIAASAGVAFNATTGIATITANGGLTVTMPTMRTLTGTVKVGAVNLADAWVEIFDPSNGGVHFGAKADANGAFSLKIADGSYMINAMKPGYYRDPSALTVNSGTAAQTITLAAASTTIEGTVYIGSAGAANAFVRAEKQGGGFAGTQADANGVYKLYVTSGIWRVYAVAEGYAETAYASNPIDVTSASVTGKNITVSTAVNVAAPKSKSITPANGGTLEDTATGIKLTFPGTSLGSSTSSGNVEAKETNNVRETSTAKPLKNLDSTTGTYINSGKTVTATVVDSTGSSTAVTTLNPPATIEMTYTKAELAATASASDTSINTKAEADAVKMGYWDESTASWVTQPTTITYKDVSGNIITDATAIDTPSEFSAAVSTVIISATTDHLSLYAPVSTVGTTPPATPTGLAAAAASSSQITLTWTASSGATGYDIYRSATSGGTFARLGSEPTVGAATTYSNIGLSGSTAYYYKISALNGSGESASSSEVTATTSVAASSSGGGFLAPTLTPTPKPAVPIIPAIPAIPASSSGVTLYRVSGDNRVYVVKDGKKTWIKSAEEFNSKGYKWADIAVASPSALASYPEETAAAIVSKVKVVNTLSLRVRQSNTTKSNAIAKVKRDETFTVLDQSNGWYKIQLSSGAIGWISGAYAALAEETTNPSVSSGIATIAITALSLRIRSINSASGKVLGAVRKNEKYSVLEENAGWFKIKTLKGITGWISGAYAVKQ